MKQKIVFKCSGCAYQSVKWLGCCPECKEWDSFIENRPIPTIGAHVVRPTIDKAMVSLAAIPTVAHKRMLSGIKEWDRVIGGGLVPGSLLILTGDPGIGKSTLLLQISSFLSHQHRVYYFSTEESLQQVKLRAQRLNCLNEQLLFSDQADLASILTIAQQEKPDIIILDSIQNCYASQSQTFPGTIGQLRESVFQLMRLAKEHTITIIMSGHITKDGMMAGPKTLEHMVDGVFYLQGEDRWQLRVLRSVKNRFGTINELGFFNMHHDGLQEVPNINEHLLNEVTCSPGSTLVSVVEGSRPLLLELQTLCIASKLTIAQRVISGLDPKQVVLIAALLEKYVQVRFSAHDIFAKVSGGFKIKDSSADLGVALALLSSYFQQPLPEKSLVLGELSMTGHVKPVSHINMYIREAEKFGIKKLFVATNQKLEETSCHIHRFSHVYELLTLFELK